MKRLTAELINLAQLQCGLLTSRQLAVAGFQRRELELRIGRGEWQRVSERVIATHNQPLTRSARLWAASLHYERCALAGSSVLELLGLPMPVNGVVHLIGPRAGFRSPMARCVIHTSTTLAVEQHDPDRVGLAMAVMQALRWAISDDQAVFHATWALQRRLVRIEDLQELSINAKSSPGSERMNRRLRHLAPGIDSLGEYYFAVECAKRGLPEPLRQRVRLDSRGIRRFMDAEFRQNGRSLVVEVDGAHHLDPDVHQLDQWRANEVALQGAPVLRVSVVTLKVNPEPFFDQLRRGLDALRRIA